MKVKDHTKFACFDYINFKGESILQLGDIVTKKDDGDVGVVIQVHDKYEFRTDMFGNACDDEVRISTLNEILNKRKDLTPFEKHLK